MARQQVETAVGCALEENRQDVKRSPGSRRGERLTNEICRAGSKRQSQVLDFIVRAMCPWMITGGVVKK